MSVTRLVCARCQGEVVVNDVTNGRSIRCPKCGAVGTWTERDGPPASRGSATVSSSGTARGSAAGWPSVANYEILSELGRGGMGVVYKARDVKLKRTVALKMILSAEHAGAQDLERFRVEAEAVARVQHPNIVQIYEIGEQDGRPFFSLEFVDGGSLDRKLDGTPLAPLQAAELLQTLARAMHAVHQQGIIHRDLKPANVLIQESGPANQESGVRSLGPDKTWKTPPEPCRVAPDSCPKITDFGLAKQIDSDVARTRTGAVMGTPSYMAPEQAMGQKDIGPPADIYALGAMLYEVLTGRPPFKGITPMDTLLQVIADEPVPPTRLQPTVPRDLETICLKCLQKEPPRRYLSAGALADDLARFVRGDAIEARPQGLAERAVKWARRRPAVAALLALVLIVAAVGFAGISWKWLEAESARRDADGVRRLAEDQTQKTETALEQARTNLYYHSIALAHREWQLKHVGRAVQLLEDCPRSRRNWEWYYLRHICHGELRTLVGHTDQVMGVAFSPDGKRLASTSVDRTVRIWDTDAGKLLATLKGHNAEVWCAAFSLDGKRLASASADKTVKVWDVATGAELLTFRGHTRGVRAVVFSPDGESVVSAGGQILVWHPATGKVQRTLGAAESDVHSIAFSPDGQRLAAVGHHTPLELWDWKTGKSAVIPKPHERAVYAVAFSPNNVHVATASADNTVRLWDANQRRLAFTLRGPTDLVSKVAFSHDGQRVVGASSDQTLMVWGLKAGEDSLLLRGHTAQVYAVAFSPDGTRIASGSGDHTVKLWDSCLDPEVRTVRQGKCESIAFRPDGKELASANRDPTVTVLDPATGIRIRTLGKKEFARVESVAYSADGRFLAAGGATSTGGEAAVWDGSTAAPLLRLHRQASPINRVALTPDGRLLATGTGDFGLDNDHNPQKSPGIIKVWQLPDGKEQYTLTGHAHGISTLAFHPENGQLASADEEGIIKLWDLSSGRELRTLRGHAESVHRVAFSPDGQKLASASTDGSTKLWDLASGQVVLTLRGHTRSVSDIVFSPDGRRLASASADRNIKLWDAQTGQEIMTLIGHGAVVNCVAFSPDGRRLASASDDGTIKFWDAPLKE